MYPCPALPSAALPVMSFPSSHLFLGSLAWPHQIGPTRDDGLLHKGCFTPQPHLFSCGVAPNHGGLDWEESAKTSIQMSRPPSHSGAGRLFFFFLFSPSCRSAQTKKKSVVGDYAFRVRTREASSHHRKGRARLDHLSRSVRRLPHPGGKSPRSAFAAFILQGSRTCRLHPSLRY